MKWAIGIVIVVLLVFGVYWWATTEKRHANQLYDCRERTGDNLPMAAECLVHRYGWDDMDARIKVYADAYDRRYAP